MRDGYGDGKSMCRPGPFRDKVLCCNAPSNANPFLPVALDRIFPTLPSPADIPSWKLLGLGSPARITSSGELNGPNSQGFGFVVIDGSPGAVSNLEKRESGYEFLDCPIGSQRQTLR